MDLSGSGEGAVPSPVMSDHDPARARPADRPGAWEDQSAGVSARQTHGRTDLSPPRGDGRRPELPRRHAQANLAPELLNVPVPGDDHDDADTGYNPGLMAAFQKGMRSAQEEDTTDGTGGTG
jgi:hypothetical protein